MLQLITSIHQKIPLIEKISHSMEIIFVSYVIEKRLVSRMKNSYKTIRKLWTTQCSFMKNPGK